MRNPYKYFYNAVIHEDLFFTIYDYLRFNPSAARQYNVFSTSDLFEYTLICNADFAPSNNLEA